MRLKRSRVKTYHHQPAVEKKDGEGNSYIDYRVKTTFGAEVWAAGGKLQAEIYGNRMVNIMNCRVPGEYTVCCDEKGITHYKHGGGTVFTVGDGILVNSSHKPDYRIISIKPYRYLTMELERI